MRRRQLQLKVSLGLVWARLDADANCLRGDHNASHPRQRGLRLVLGQADVVAVHQTREEQEHLHAGKSIAQAPPATHSERHEEVWSVDMAIGANETLRDELLGFVPKRGVHVHALDQWNNLGASWDRVTVQFDLTKDAKEEKKRERHG